jgi:hypothetical protein
MIFCSSGVSSPNVFIGDPLFMLPGFPVKLGMTENSYFAKGLILITF